MAEGASRQSIDTSSASRDSKATVAFWDICSGFGIVLHCGDAVGEVHHFGPAHTAGDAVVYVPSERVFVHRRSRAWHRAAAVRSVSRQVAGGLGASSRSSTSTIWSAGTARCNAAVHAGLVSRLSRGTKSTGSGRGGSGKSLDELQKSSSLHVLRAQRAVRSRTRAKPIAPNSWAWNGNTRLHRCSAMRWNKSIATTPHHPDAGPAWPLGAVFRQNQHHRVTSHKAKFATWPKLESEHWEAVANCG